MNQKFICKKTHTPNNSPPSKKTQEKTLPLTNIKTFFFLPTTSDSCALPTAWARTHEASLAALQCSRDMENPKPGIQVW